jgi:hypothetical protein
MSVIFLIIAVAVIVGFVYIILAPVKYIDCGTDYVCMEENAIQCRPSKVLITKESFQEDPNIPEEEFEPIELEIGGVVKNYTPELLEEPEITLEFIVHGSRRGNCNIELNYIEGGPGISSLKCSVPQEQMRNLDDFDISEASNLNNYCEIII